MVLEMLREMGSLVKEKETALEKNPDTEILVAFYFGASLRLAYLFYLYKAVS